MTRIYIKSILIIFLCTTLASGCGGGGNGGSDARNLGGLWSGALIRLSDACNNGDGATLQFSHQVTQNEEAVTLIYLALSFLGNTVGTDGFSVDASRSTAVSNQTCSEALRIEYENIDDSDDATADVDFTILRTCPGRAACEVAYTGTASRGVSSAPATPTSSPGAPVATATPAGTVSPTGTTIPVAGGCQAINPNPADGEYSGDGGCGISTAKFTFQQQATEGVVLLEPFGANGPTSFTVSAANPSSATSKSADLTINSAAGNTCNITCSPPATFTVDCLAEGQAHCVEKF